jgi:hypothetical protein
MDADMKAAERKQIEAYRTPRNPLVKELAGNEAIKVADTVASDRHADL